MAKQATNHKQPTEAQLQACAKIDAGKYEVQSSTGEGFYDVTWNERYQRWQCICKWAREGVGTPCQHVRAVIYLEAIEADAARHDEIEAVRREAQAIVKDGWKAYARQPLKLENGIPMR